MSDEGTCHAKGCDREVADEGDSLCQVCVIELEVLMKAEMAKRLGREPTGVEFDMLIDRVLARAIDPKREPTP